MTIGVWSYLEEYGDEKEEILEAIGQVLDSGQLILGPEVQDFESAFATWNSVAHGVGVANGTDAISLALRALGVEPGDEVITVSNTAVPTVSAIVAIGAVPRFVDILPDTYLMDVSQIEGQITSRTKCLLPVHLFGQCVDMDPLLEMASAHKLMVMEDCAQSHGALYKGRKAGSMGDASSFSFYPTKILGTYGDGGMVLTNDSDVDAKLRRLRFYGMEKTYFSVEDGVNSRLDELHAAILRKKLAHLDDYLNARQRLATSYTTALSDTALALPQTAENNSHAYYLYVASHPERDAIIEALAKQDIRVNVSYRWPIHTMPPFKAYLTDGQALPQTEEAACRIFSLPMYPSVSDADQTTVIDALIEISGRL